MSVEATQARAVESAWGHPQEIWDALVLKAQGAALTRWDEVRDDWLELMWCHDQYRIAGVPPRGMGNLKLSTSGRLEGVYRKKGHQFATLLNILLDNRTGQTLRSASSIKGFSQNHQIDLAWPDRDESPIVCAETKVTGGPAYADKPGRGAMDDWTNRRRELKFSAADLKLARREQVDKIGHWDVWRRAALPRTFMLWAALLGPKDSPAKMVRETSSIVDTYLDGAGIFAFARRSDGRGYEEVPLSLTAGVETLDSALYRIESEIEQALASGVYQRRAESSAPHDPQTLIDDEQAAI